MKTKVVRPTSHNIKAAAKAIAAGKLVVFPTETVYGLGASAFNRKAVLSIFKAKKRPADNPLIVHIADEKVLPLLVTKIPPAAKKLIKKYWPGPLTIVLPKTNSVPAEVVAGGKTVAIRMPAHPVALELIKRSGVPIAAPSANLSGRPSPTTAKHVLEDMKGRVDYIIDGGDCKYGVESTVIDLSTKTPFLLRPGAITLEQLRAVLGEVNIANPDAKKPRSPGMKYRHYSPQTKFILIEGRKGYGDEALGNLLGHNTSNKIKTAVICYCHSCTSIKKNRYVHYHAIAERGNLHELAKEIFKTLRNLDKLNYDCMVMRACPESGIGLAVMNRVRKAAHKIVK